MPELEPVSGDPFLQPVSGDPFLQPVQGDPFAEGMTLQGNVAQVAAKLEAEQAARKSMLGSLTARYTLPGRLVAGVQPETPGTMTEEDAYRQNQLEAEAQGWGPEQAAAMLKTGVPFAKPGTIGAAGGGIKAYHGSPHDFEKFDVSKIGTGEGAQAYGHGLYFAENPSVAEAYKNDPKMMSFARGKDWTDEHEAAFNWLHENGYDTKRASEAVANRIAQAKMYGDTAEATALLKAEKAIIDSGWQPPRGRMYEVNINADPEHFLDWDKPLSEQTERAKEFFGYGGKDDKRTVEEAYRGLGARRGEADVSSRLQEAGIPGIKYLDQGSRITAGVDKIGDNYFIKGSATPYKTRAEAEAASKEAGNATHNYVVFHHDLIDIIKKYGLAGLIAGGAAHFKTQPHDGDPFADSQ